MPTKGEGAVIAIVVGAAATAGAVYLARGAKAAVPVASISIVVVPNPDAVNNPVTVTATAVDTSGNPVSGASLYLFVDDAVQSPSGSTNSSGVATFTVTPQTAGTYAIFVSSDSAGT